MPDYSPYQINIETPQSNGRKGESPRAAFTKYNDLLAALGNDVGTVSAEAPLETVPYMAWIDISVDPAMFRRRNAGNTAWVEIGPALAQTGDPLQKAQNLADLEDAAVARDNLGLGTAAVGDLQKLSTDYYGPTAPGTTWPGMTWARTTDNLLLRRNAANDDWVIIGELFVRPVSDSNPNLGSTLTISGSGSLQLLTSGRVEAYHPSDTFIDLKNTEAADWEGRIRLSNAGDLVIQAAKSVRINSTLVFGDGQVWQSVTRSMNTNYTNSTGRPILASLRGTFDSGSAFIGIQISGFIADQVDVVSGRTNAVCCVIPQGAVYQYRTAGTTGIITYEYA